MLNNNLGFTYIRSLISFSIAVSLVITIMPTITFLSLERQKLIDHKMIATTLQSHLQTTISQPTPPLKQNFLEVVNNKEVHFSINRTGNLLEGCAVWKDAKTKETDLCLYYYQKQ